MRNPFTRPTVPATGIPNLRRLARRSRAAKAALTSAVLAAGVLAVTGHADATVPPPDPQAQPYYENGCQGRAMKYVATHGRTFPYGYFHLPSPLPHFDYAHEAHQAGYTYCPHGDKLIVHWSKDCITYVTGHPSGATEVAGFRFDHVLGSPDRLPWMPSSTVRNRDRESQQCAARVTRRYPTWVPMSERPQSTGRLTVLQRGLPDNVHARLGRHLLWPADDWKVAG